MHGYCYIFTYVSKSFIGNCTFCHLLNITQIVKFLGIMTALEKLDYEKHPSYNFKVKVADNAGHSCASDVFINVLDVNDNKPQFMQSLYVATVRENTTRSVVITQVCRCACVYVVDSLDMECSFNFFSVYFH